MPDYKLIIFDFDGTLVDSCHLGFELFQKNAQRYHFKEMKDFTEYQQLMTYSLPQILWQLRLSPLKLKKILSEQFEDGTESLMKCAVFPDIEKVIKTIAHYYPLCIVSSNLDTAVEKYLEKKHLKKYFSLIIGAEKIKDKPTKLKTCLKTFSVVPSQTLFIGDSVRDVRDGKRVGLDVCAVTYGIHSGDTLQKEKPTYLIDSASGILQLLNH